MPIEISIAPKQNPKDIGVFVVKKNIQKFSDIKDKILGAKYDLSIVFIGIKRSRELNFTYRDRDLPTDILSFPISDKSGEIFICPQIVKKKSKEFEQPYDKYMIYLVIHGILHLKGMDHGSKMDNAEKKYLDLFNRI